MTSFRSKPDFQVDVERSLLLMQSLKTRNRECFENAIKVVLSYPAGTRNLRYVEGWAVSKFGLVVQHGWAELDGKIIETTPIWLDDVLDHRDSMAYFPCVRWYRAQIAHSFNRAAEVYLPFTARYYIRDKPYHEIFIQQQRAANVFVWGEEKWQEVETMRRNAKRLIL